MNVRTMSLIIVVSMLCGCTTDTLVTPEIAETEAFGAQDEAAAAAAAAAKASHTARTVFRIADLSPVGSAKIVRNDHGVTINLSTTGLIPGEVVTLWAVLFNAPHQCVGDVTPFGTRCDVADLFNADAMPDVVYVAGRRIGGSGKATYAGRRNEGDNSGSILPVWLGLPSPGLIDARTAEIHLIVHTHGQAIPALIDEMLHSFNAGCGPVFDPALPDVPEDLGTHGPNTCMDIQVAVDPPPAG